MKKNILIVSEKCNSFYFKYLTNLVNALINKDVSISVLIGENVILKFTNSVKIYESKEFIYWSGNIDEHRYLEIFKIANEQSINFVHLCRLFDPQRFYSALQAEKSGKNCSYSFSIFGISDYLRKPIFRYYLDSLLDLGITRKVLLHSIYPAGVQRYCEEKKLLQNKNIRFVGDPIYDDKTVYVLKKNEARNNIGIRHNKKIILYFGAFFLSKGPDILQEVAHRMIDRKDVIFLFAGDTKSATFNFNKDKYKDDNLHFDDRYIDEESVVSYILASDLVVLPYRKFYEHNTSGVLIQSCLGKRPVMVPDIPPFKDVVIENDLGFIFKCENIDSLEKEIRLFLETNNDKKKYGYEKYLSKIESWDNLASIVLDDINI